MLPDISVSIASYNTSALLRRCLAALERVAAADGVAIQIIIADNGSADDSLEMAAREFPAALRLALGGNLGYGRANNQALKHAQGRYFLILNSDTEVEMGSLKNFVAFMDTHPTVGAAGARLISPDGSTQISWTRDPSLFWTFCEQTFLDRLPAIQQKITGSTGLGAHDAEREVEQVSGAALLVRREVFEQVGGFDEQFFMYYEDTDLCARIRAAGHRVFYLPQVRIQHILGASSENLAKRADMVVSCNKSRELYFKIHHDSLQSRLVKFFAVGGALLRTLLWFGATLKGGKSRTSAQAKLNMFRDILRRTLR